MVKQRSRQQSLVDEEIIKLQKKLREISQDTNVTNEAREKIAAKINKLKPKVDSKKEPVRKGGGPDFMITKDMLVGLKKGGEVKGYHKGGPVHNKKNTMATTKGWGASRKT